VGAETDQAPELAVDKWTTLPKPRAAHLPTALLLLLADRRSMNANERRRTLRCVFHLTEQYALGVFFI
jgi:hypothetical protein